MSLGRNHYYIGTRGVEDAAPYIYVLFIIAQANYGSSSPASPASSRPSSGVPSGLPHTATNTCEPLG